MRTVTAPERSTVAGSRVGHFGKLEITDSTGAWVDVSVGLRNPDWLNAVTISETIDQNAAQLSGSLLLESGALSLSPFRSDSLLNQVGGSYATMLDLWRRWRLSISAMPPGYPPNGSDWKALAEGRLDTIDVRDPPGEIQITGRSEEAVLIQKWIACERQYGSIGGIAMETVLQSMLDDNLGAGMVTLYTPVSPSYLMNTWTQPKDSLMTAMAAVAAKAGFVLRYRYDASNVFRLTLFKPNRTATVEDWSLGPSEYTALPKFSIDITGVRNFIKLRFAHPTLGIQTVIYPHMAGTGTVTCTTGAATFSSSQAGVLQNGAEIIVAGIPYTVSGFSGTTTCTLLSQLASGGVPTFTASAFTAHGTLSGAGTTASIDRFGRIDMELDLSYDTQVNDSTKSQGMCDAVGSDMEFPNLEQQYEALAFWFVQLHDYGRFLANRVHSDVDQLAGVTSISHQFSNATVKSLIGVRGKPAGRYTTWKVLGQNTGPANPASPPYKRAKPWDDFKFVPRASDAGGGQIDTGVKGFVDFAIQNAGATTFFGANRHNDEKIARDSSGTQTFGVAFDNTPQMRAIPQSVQVYKAADTGSDQRLDVRAINITASTFDPRAKLVKGGSSTPKTNLWATTLNGGTAASQTIQNDGAAVFCDLADANGTLTLYTARFDVDTRFMNVANTLIVRLYKNNGTGSTSWTLVDTRTYSAGQNLTNETLDFNAAMTLDWDVRLLINYQNPPTSPERATVVARDVTYNVLTGATEVDATTNTSDAVLYQAMEAP
jgi:hypothetical protein